MTKYRIVEKKITNDLCQVKYEYRIQKKFLWFWVEAGIDCAWHSSHGGLCVTTRYYTYSTLHEAQAILKKIKGSSITTYKGYGIWKVYSDVDRTTEIFILLGKEFVDGEYYHSYFYTINEAIARIDKLITRVEKRIIQ